MPEFLLRLATDTRWDDEELCFHSIAMIVADYYALLPQIVDDIGYKGTSVKVSQVELSNLLESLLYPAMRMHLIPSEAATPFQSTFIEVAALEQLYKVFERC